MAAKTNISWTDVPDWPGFQVNETGELRGPSGRILRPMARPEGYLYVQSRLGSKSAPNRKLYVHRALLMAFVRLPKHNEEARHLNGNCQDNRLENLAWGTRWDQRADDQKNGVIRRPVNSLSVGEIQAIRQSSESSRTLGVRFGRSHSTILYIKRGRRYKEVMSNA